MPWFRNSWGLGALGAEHHGATRIDRRDLPAHHERASMESLDTIHALVREGREDPLVRDVAIKILRKAGVPERDKGAAIRAVCQWVKDHLYYVNDPINVETIATARVILQQALNGGASGWDCDDFVVLGQSLLQSAGINTRSVIIKGDGRDPSQWTHIYFEAHDGRQWVPCDLIMRDKPIGWAPPNVHARRVVPVGTGAPYPTERLGRAPRNAQVEYAH